VARDRRLRKPAGPGLDRRSGSVADRERMRAHAAMSVMRRPASRWRKWRAMRYPCAPDRLARCRVIRAESSLQASNTTAAACISSVPDHQQHVGVSGSYVQGEGTGLNWSARTWDNMDDDCGNGFHGADYHHHQDNGGQIMYFYDDRNTD
jgi:hypothetical protein